MNLFRSSPNHTASSSTTAPPTILTACPFGGCCKGGKCRFSPPLIECYAAGVKTIPTGLLNAAVERLKAEFQPEEIYLFGSHAWGVPTEDSDVDFMVIVPSSDERPIRRMQRAHRCLRGIGFAKDVLVSTRVEFDRYRHLKASLSHKIFQDGRKLYGQASE